MYICMWLICVWVGRERELGTSREGLQENSQPRDAHRELAEKDHLYSFAQSCITFITRTLTRKEEDEAHRELNEKMLESRSEDALVLLVKLVKSTHTECGDCSDCLDCLDCCDC